MYLQIISAILLLLNKIFLIKSPKWLGWVCGILGVIFINIFYFRIIAEQKSNLWIMIVSNSALIFLMFYGLLVVLIKGKKILENLLEKYNIFFKIVVISITFIICIFLFIKLIKAELVIVQFIYSASVLFGTL